MPTHLIKNLRAKAKEIDYKAKTKDNDVVRARCDLLFDMYTDMVSQLEKSVPDIGILKGRVGGLRLAVDAVKQHKEIYKQECKDKKISKDEFAMRAQIVDRCMQSVSDAANQQREELLQVAGKAEGFAGAAGNILGKIKENVDNMLRQADFIDENKELFDDATKADEPETSAEENTN